MEYSNNYNLKLPEQTDIYNIDDFNDNMYIIDSEIKARETQIDNTLNQIDNLSTNVGDKATLVTTDKTSVVNAINATSNEIGILSNLTTTEKTNLVGAVNEVDADLQSHKSDYEILEADNISYKVLENYLPDIQGFFDNLNPDIVYNIQVSTIIDITTNLDITDKKIVLTGAGGFRLTNSISGAMVNFTGCDILNIDGVTFDANSLAGEGLRFTDSPAFVITERTTVKNVGNSTLDNVRAIWIRHGCPRYQIHCKIINTEGASIARAILSGSTETPTIRSTDFEISRCYIDTVKPAADGDAIVIDANDLTVNINGKIHDNYFLNPYKRFVKVMASRVDVYNNIGLRNVNGAASSALSLYGNNCKAYNNDFEAVNNAFLPMIDTQGSGHDIHNNNIRNDADYISTSDGFDLDGLSGGNINDVKIYNNDIFGCRFGMRLKTVNKNCLFQDNMLRKCTNNNVSINGTSDGLSVLNNKTEDTDTAKIFINLNSQTVTNLTVINNHTQAAQGISSTTRESTNVVADNFINGAKAEIEFVNGVKYSYRPTDPPTSGAYIVGDRWVNTAITERGTTPNKFIEMGAVNIVAGSPGTWARERFTTGN